jgi:glucose-1-phosphate cytidylyltransferase
VKVVIFCGGQGIRLREYAETVPKPMVPIGPRPVLWHVMRYYAHFGHCDFILCLGYRADAIKEYFLRYSEAVSNDFVLADGGRSIELLATDIADWRITFVDTGLQATIAQRLRAVRPHLEGDDVFLANYGDVLTDAPINDFIERFQASGRMAAFLAVRPSYSFHVVRTGADDAVTSLTNVRDADIWINGGHFIFRQGIFDYIEDAEELVEQPFARLIEGDRLAAYKYEGFWAPMDTLKEVQMLQAMYESGKSPWTRWTREPGARR